jgi:hypothetical protein
VRRLGARRRPLAALLAPLLAGGSIAARDYAAAQPGAAAVPLPAPPQQPLPAPLLLPPSQQQQQQQQQQQPALPGEPQPAAAVALSGWAQIDAVAYSGDSVDELDPASGAPLNQERLLVRRARLRAAVDRGALGASLELDGNTVDGAALRLLAAEVRFRHERGALTLAVAAGLFKTPFGAELPLPDRERFFLEPSRAARALFPGSYDAGVKASGRWKLLRWSVAAVNGAPPGEVQFRGRDPSSSFDLVGRVGAEGGSCGVTLTAGLSALTGRGFHPGAPATKDELVWLDANENGLVELTELQVRDGDPATPSQEFDHRALGVDVAGTWWWPGVGRGRAAAELVVAENLDRGLLVGDPVAQSRDLRELGWHVEVEQQVARWARLGVRYDRYQPDRDAFEARGVALVGTNPTWSTWSVVAALEDGGRRLALGYEHEQNPLGRGDDGAPRTRSADRVTVRGQVGF